MWQSVLPDAEIISLGSYRCIQTAGDVIAWADFENLPTDEVKKQYEFCSGSHHLFTANLEDDRRNYYHVVIAFLTRLRTFSRKVGLREYLSCILFKCSQKNLSFNQTTIFVEDIRSSLSIGFSNLFIFFKEIPDHRNFM